MNKMKIIATLMTILILGIMGVGMQVTPTYSSGTSIIDVSPAVRITDTGDANGDGNYERDPQLLIASDDTWFLTYSKSKTSFTHGGNPDTLKYDVWVKISTDGGVTWLGETKVLDDSNFRSSTICEADGKIWVIGVDWSDGKIYANTYSDGNWIGQVEIYAGSTAWHVDSIAEGDDIRLFFGQSAAEGVGFIKYDHTTETWETMATSIGVDASGPYIPRVTKAGDIYYLVSVSDDWKHITFTSTDAPKTTPWPDAQIIMDAPGTIMPYGICDPTILKYGDTDGTDDLIVFAAPWYSDDSQTIEYAYSTDAGVSWTTSPISFTDAAHDGQVSWDMMPRAYLKDPDTIMLFYGMEQRGVNRGQGDIVVCEWDISSTIGNKHYTTIQDGIDNAIGGDTILVAAGTYDEKVVIDKSLTLLGAKAGEDARTRDTSSGESILDGTGLAPETGVGAFNIEDGVSDVIIDGFEIHGYLSINPGGGSAVMAYCYDGDTLGRSRITILNNYMHDLGWNGILVWSNNDVVQEDFTIQFNLIEEAPYAGIELTNVINSKVLDNKIVAPTSIVNDPGDAGVGIEIAVRAQPGFGLTAGTNVLVEGNEISGTFAEGSRAGINILSRTYSSSSDATLTGVTVRDNIVSADVIVGILVVAESRDSGPATITDLEILDNKINNFEKGGVVVKDVLSVQIEGNTISTTKVSPASNGIQVGYIGATTGTTGAIKDNQVSDCHWEGYDPSTETYEDDWTASGILVIDTESELTISGNEVQNCDVGFDIEAGALTTITKNDVHGNSYGFVLWNANPTINYNNIHKNTLFGVYRTILGSSNDILDATLNWWGHPKGPGWINPAGKVVNNGEEGDIDTDPWLKKPIPPGQI